MKKHLLIVIALSLISLYSFCQNIDSLKIALKKANHDTTRCKLLNSLIDAEPDDDIWPLYNEELKKLTEKKLETDLNPDQKKYYLKHLANSLNNIGYLANKHGDIKKAIDYYHRSLKIQEKIEDKIGIANSFINIGSIYDKQGDNNKALEYNLKSLKLLEEINDKTIMATCLNNIGANYFNQNNISKALIYYQKSLTIQEETNDKDGVAYSLNNIGSIYDKQGDIKKALVYIHKSLKIREEINNLEGMGFSLNYIAWLHMKEGEYNEALDFGKRGLKISQQIGFPSIISNCAATLKYIYKRQNKYKEAFEMYELELKMRDSIINQKTRTASVKKQLEYMYEKKEIFMKAEQEKKDALTNAELKQKEKERNYFIVGFSLVIVLALFILRGYWQKQKANKIIIEQKKLVDVKQKEILDSIHYAKRIQTTLMPTENYINKQLNQLKSTI
jgi:tetratricopeptide (TPR) repeat protein